MTAEGQHLLTLRGWDNAGLSAFFELVDRYETGSGPSFDGAVAMFFRHRACALVSRLSGVLPRSDSNDVVLTDELGRHAELLDTYQVTGELLDFAPHGIRVAPLNE